MKRKKNHPVKAFGINISKLVQTVDGKDHKITQEEYDYRKDFKPSRNIRLLYKDEIINLAVCVDVPKRAKNEDTPPPPALRRSGDGGGNFRGTDIDLTPYKALPADRLVEWDDNREKLWLNKDHTFITKYFKCENGFVSGSTRHRRSLDLYKSWSSLAFSLSQACDKASLTARGVDDPMNYLLNQILHAEIAGCPLMSKQIERIDKLIDSSVGDSEDSDEED